MYLKRVIKNRGKCQLVVWSVRFTD